MSDTRHQEPHEGPNGIDRWTSNGYGLTIDGIDIKSPTEKEAHKPTRTISKSATDRFDYIEEFP